MEDQQLPNYNQPFQNLVDCSYYDNGLLPYRIGYRIYRIRELLIITLFRQLPLALKLSFVRLKSMVEKTPEMKKILKFLMLI